MANFSRNASIVHLPIAASAGSPPPGDGCWSHSRLSRFAQCPLSYKLHYVDQSPAEDSASATFGMVLRMTLDAILIQHVYVCGDTTGALDRVFALHTYRQEWAFSGLTDPDLFNEGKGLITAWIAREGSVNPEDVLGIDEEFELQVGDVRLVGRLPRVDRIADDAIRVRAYKSTRMPLSREDAEESLQLAIYDLAARELWPWAKRVEVGFDLLRHEVVVTTERTDAQREATQEYILATVAQIAKGDFPARPGALCAHCDHRAQCPAWAEARAGKRMHAGAAPEDLPAVVREREELAVVLKALGERKDALDDILRAQLEHQPELRLEGHRYTLQVAMRREYPLAGTLLVLGDAGVPRDRALEKVGAVDGNALKALIRALAPSIPPEKLASLRDRLDAVAKCSPVTRLIVKEVRS